MLSIDMSRSQAGTDETDGWIDGTVYKGGGYRHWRPSQSLIPGD